MWIVAVAWIYVVGLMAVTEASVVAGIMTFFLYCVFPLSILYYLTGSRRRTAKRERLARAAGAGGSPGSASAGNDHQGGRSRTQDKDSDDGGGSDSSDGGSDGGSGD